MIEKMKKIVSSHQAALDFDKGFLTKVRIDEGYDLVSEVKSEKVGLLKTVIKQKEGVRWKSKFQTIGLSMTRKIGRASCHRQGPCL